MKNETAFAQFVRSRLEARGAFVFKIHGHGAQQPGIPDLFVQHPVWAGWIELKFKNGKLSLVQEIIIKRIRACGGKVAVLRWKDGFAIDECDERDALLSMLRLDGTEI